jgi:hypothetical protein
MSRLPQRLLGHPNGGALAVVGHVERALGSSFLGQPSGTPVSPTTFRGSLRRIMLGDRLGAAIEPFHERYAELCVALAEEIRQIHSFGKVAKPLDLARMWIGTADARGYAIFGDPAVRLAMDAAPSPEHSQMTIGDVGARMRDEPDPAARPADPPPPLTADGGTGGPDGSAPAGPSTPATSVPGPTVGATPGIRLEIDAATGRITVSTQAATLPTADAVPPTDPVAYGWPFTGGSSALAEMQDKVVGSLKEAAEGLGAALKNLVVDVSTLQVTTYVSGDIDEVTYDPGRHAFVGPAGRHMQTCIRLDGDTVVLVPADTGADDQALWKMHTDAVERAQAHRAELIKAVSDAVVALAIGLRPG